MQMRFCGGWAGRHSPIPHVSRCTGFSGESRGRRPNSFLGLSLNDRTILYSLQSYWIRQSQSDKTVFSLGRSPERRGDDPGSLSHRRFHLNRNLLDKNIRPSSARRDWEVKGGKRGSLSLSRLQVVALTGPPVNFGGKVNSSICVSGGGSVLLPRFGSGRRATGLLTILRRGVEERANCEQGNLLVTVVDLSVGRRRRWRHR